MTVRQIRAAVSNRTLAHGLPQRLYGRMRGQLYLDLGGPEATLLLAGSPRSGTTWVAEQVVAHQGIRLVFEPFHPDNVDLAREIGPRRYLRPSNVDARFVEPARRILSGRLRSTWTDRYNRALLPRRRLVKEVRANLMLGWLHARFPQMPMVLVLRHPGAVAASQRSVPWNFHAETDRLLVQPELMEDHLRPFQDLLESASSTLEQTVAVWCVENHVPLRQFRRGDIHLVCYEHLLSRPEEEFRRLLSFYGLPFRGELLETLGLPSGVTARGSAVVSGGDMLRAWENKVSPGDRDLIVRLLAPFGLDRLYGPGPMPLLEEPNDLLSPPL